MVKILERLKIDVNSDIRFTINELAGLHIKFIQALQPGVEAHFPKLHMHHVLNKKQLKVLRQPTTQINHHSCLNRQIT